MLARLIVSGKRKAPRSAAATVVASLVAHGLLVTGVVYASLAPSSQGNEDAEDPVVNYVDVVSPPPPPPPPSAPPPIPATPPPPPPPLGFQDLIAPDLVPLEIPPIDRSAPPVLARDFGGIGARGGRADGVATTDTVPNLSAGPSFTPFEVAPGIRNPEEVARHLRRAYPPMLQSAGVGGTVLVWFLVDEGGAVRRTQVFLGSGYASLDDAAIQVAPTFEFTPALVRGEAVSVWIQVPIVFQIAPR